MAQTPRQRWQRWHRACTRAPTLNTAANVEMGVKARTGREPCGPAQDDLPMAEEGLLTRMCPLPSSGACSRGTEHPGLSRHQVWGNRHLEGHHFHTLLSFPVQAGGEHGMSREPALQAHLHGSLSPSLRPSSSAIPDPIKGNAREMPQGALGPSPHDLQPAGGLLQPLSRQLHPSISKIIITQVQLPQTWAGAEHGSQVPAAGAGQLAMSQAAREMQEKEPQDHHSHPERCNHPRASQRAYAHTPRPETLPTLMGSSAWLRARRWSHRLLQAQPLASSEPISFQKGTKGSSQCCLMEG